MAEIKTDDIENIYIINYGFHHDVSKQTIQTTYVKTKKRH